MSKFALVTVNRVRTLGLMGAWVGSVLGGLYVLNYGSIALLEPVGSTGRAVIAGLGVLALLFLLFGFLPILLMRFELITVYDGKRVRAYRWPYHFWFPKYRREAVREMDLRRAEFITGPGFNGAIRFVIRTLETEIVAEGAKPALIPDWEERWEMLQELLRGGDLTGSGSDG